MADIYKRLYEQTKKLVDQYQDEIVPGLREMLEQRVEVVRCEKCIFSHYLSGVKRYECRHPLYLECNRHGGHHFCSYGERKDE